MVRLDRRLYAVLVLTAGSETTIGQEAFVSDVPDSPDFTTLFVPLGSPGGLGAE